MIDIGMAAHIHAATPTGPRGGSGLSSAELADVSNGIWCCYSHGKAIDADNGTIYTADDLRAWKRLHEARKGMQVHGLMPDKCGLVESITVRSPAIHGAGRTVELGMLNLITGPNATGKTMLARLLTTVSDPSYVATLSRTRDIDISVKWFDPHKHQVSTSGRGGEVRHVLDGVPVPYVARPYKATMLSINDFTQPWSLTTLAQQFDLSTAAMAATLNALPENSSMIKEIDITDAAVTFVVDRDGRTTKIASDAWPQASDLNLPIFVELACAHARHHARVEPTLLILDEFLDRTHDRRLHDSVLTQLEQESEHAQVAIISHHPSVVRRCDQAWTHTSFGETGQIHHSERSASRKPIDIDITATDPPPHVPDERI
ncbi:hypothetical protein [Kribbella sp. VKM Ac-2566]|uniref:hypothetical protein n=1 Tax=Kribbella sp. VKM Ac-2566 TaxID=2512218 RepID=UPI0010632B3F|nr:hypothetical protein [Kribbella sp. VKM Ac-2566]